jgi:hypothetical protein
MKKTATRVPLEEEDLSMSLKMRRFQVPSFEAARKGLFICLYPRFGFTVDQRAVAKYVHA